MTDTDPAVVHEPDADPAVARARRGAALRRAGLYGAGLALGSWLAPLVPQSWRGPALAVVGVAFVVLLVWGYGTAHGARARARALEQERALSVPREVGATLVGLALGALPGYLAGLELELPLLAGMSIGTVLGIGVRRRSTVGTGRALIQRESAERRTEDRAATRLREQAARDTAWRESQGR